ncbi:HD-GYP domain-containing protein [Paenibacillus agricola]|uniref:HD-GYP domain-containing protein n=1 Tax=Paenibacillus agricola TaxID=2716264 RepID=A0ABX0J891_9BACL|nr:HD-GYP domain-containing protein [Paenibacillus agricola]NHN30324.1 HD-GYP domain-containing protein [Paenibacillus agricola]
MKNHLDLHKLAANRNCIHQHDEAEFEVSDLILKGNDHFCPVSIGKWGTVSLWVLMVVAIITAVWVNLYHSSPLLLGLYAIPVIIFTLYVANGYLVVTFAAAVMAIWLYFSEPGLVSILATAALLLISMLIRRVTVISQRNFRQKLEFEELFMNTILSFSKSIDARDPYTAFHSKNVADYAKKIATEMGLSKQDIEAVHLAGLIHDIGKIGTPENILQKESRLTEEEYDIMKRHAEDGYQIIKDIKKLQDIGATAMVRYHHERMDGKGYPQGLKGDEIPLGAKILAASDAFDAMTTNRSYRQKLSMETAAEELRRHSGTQFDPLVAEAFIKVLTEAQLIPAEEKEALGLNAVLQKA